jgi:4-amino-4-deoxychorismate lyase
MELESWQNGKWIPNSQIGTKMYDAHYFFGWAAFDSFRTFNKKPHMLDEHINRLYNSAKLAYIDFDMSKEKMKENETLSEEEKKDRIAQEILDMLLGAFENYLEIEEWDEKIMLLFERAHIIKIK